MATPEGTEKYFNRSLNYPISENAVRTFGKTGFMVNAIGFGGYRVNHKSKKHREALYHSLLHGINLVDTSSNYTDGGSELLVGATLQELMQQGHIHRDEIVVISKAGYVQGHNMTLVNQREADGNPYPDMIKYMDGCWHCIHPDFLEDQLRLTLGRLSLDSLDIYLLHNPEYFLSDARKQGILDVEAARGEYYRRIKYAFEWMEEKVREGKIQSYGISSNTFPHPADDFEFTSLELVIDTAREIAEDNHFYVIQFPFNLYETGACFECNQENGAKTLVQITNDNNIATLANRPLNAMTTGGMVRLATFRDSDPANIRDDFDKYLHKLLSLEKKFDKEYLSGIPDEIQRDSLKEVFSLAQHLNDALTFFHNWGHWDHIKQNILLPQIATYIGYLNERRQDDKAWDKWALSYIQVMEDFFDTISKQYENQANARSRIISKKLDDRSDELQTSRTLSQKTLRLLCGVPGIHCVLLGMRKIPYVEDAFAALKEPVIPDAETVLNTLDL